LLVVATGKSEISVLVQKDASSIQDFHERAHERAHEQGMDKTILIVDDADDVRQTCALYLSYEGFSVVEAADGKEAVEQAIEALPQLILMDLSLPVMSGLEATKLIKADERTRQIPVILMTAHVRRGPSAVIEAGCEGFLVKPAEPKAILAEINRVLARTSGRK
jgi:two-component system cell cycle response regulator DivK